MRVGTAAVSRSASARSWAWSRSSDAVKALGAASSEIAVRSAATGVVTDEAMAGSAASNVRREGAERRPTRRRRPRARRGWGVAVDQQMEDVLERAGGREVGAAYWR